MIGESVALALISWLSKDAFKIIDKALDNYKALTPDQIAALKKKFNKVAEAKDNEPSK